MTRSGPVGGTARLETRFTKLFGCAAPIQLAAMPGVSTPELVAAVAEAGGLGMLPTPLVPPAALEQILDALCDRAPGAFGVNFLVPFLDEDCIAIAARRAPLVEFFYGDPDPRRVDRVHALGALAGWQVGSVAEAVAAERAGCDLLVAQGTEAGGHVRGTTSLLPLLSQVLDAVEVPVVAAGGIATPRDLAAVLACGASGARIGTRFVASRESGAHPDYVRSLLDASPADTCLTEAFSVAWPHAPHRVLASAVAAANALSDEHAGETRLGDQRVPIPRFSVICPTADTTGRIDAMALYAGESVGSIRSVEAAADIVADLTIGAERLLAAAAGGGPELRDAVVEIEPYDETRRDAVVRLSLRAWAPVFASLETVMEPAVYRAMHPDWRETQRAAVEATCADPDVCAWVALEPQAVVGFVAAKLHDADRMGEIYMIAVDPDAQGRGISRALTDRALAWFRDAGMAIAMVETGGDPGHAPARRAYEAHGFRMLPIARYFKML